MPVLDGLAVCRRLRSKGLPTPILMLTARDAVPTASPGSRPGRTTTSSSRSRCPELIARIRALTRRRHRHRHPALLRRPHARHRCPARLPGRTVDRADRARGRPARAAAPRARPHAHPRPCDRRDLGRCRRAERRRPVRDAPAAQARRTAADPDGPGCGVLVAGLVSRAPSRAGPSGEQRLDLVVGHRPAEQISLGRVTPERAQVRELGVGFDTLGDDMEPERVTELDDSADDRGLLGAAAHPGDEALVDLQRVDREPLEARQRGRAGAVVVDRDLDTGALERCRASAVATSRLRITASSVISRQSAPGGTWLASIAFVSSVARPASSSWRKDRLIETVISGRDRRQRTTCVERMLQDELTDRVDDRRSPRRAG